MLEMRWKDYDETIVATHHVTLEGWPFPDKFNAALLTAREMRCVLESINKGETHWRKLTEEEVEQRAEERTRALKQGRTQKRKGRSDKGQPRRPEDSVPAKRRRLKSAETVHDSDSEDDGIRKDGPAREDADTDEEDPQ